MAEETIFPVEDLLALQNAGDVNRKALQKLRNEAFEHLLKDVNETDHQKWSYALNSKGLSFLMKQNKLERGFLEPVRR